MPNCFPPSRASTRTSARAIHPELFAWLARVSPALDAVWDCGCGSGQASVALAEHFSVVHATDVAPEQVAAAKPHPRVRYSVAPAEHSGLAAAAVNLVTVAQALHWFDVEAFYAEARRVARPDALARRLELSAAASSSTRSSIAAFLEFYSDVVGPYWPPERRHIEANYTTLPFPFEEMQHPAFGLELDWRLDQVHRLREQLVGDRAVPQGARATIPCRCCGRSLGAGVAGAGATAPMRMPIGLRVARLHVVR